MSCTEAAGLPSPGLRTSASMEPGRFGETAETGSCPVLPQRGPLLNSGNALVHSSQVSGWPLRREEAPSLETATPFVPLRSTTLPASSFCERVLNHDNSRETHLAWAGCLGPAHTIRGSQSKSVG
jgi:hypothetical protein